MYKTIASAIIVLATMLACKKTLVSLPVLAAPLVDSSDAADTTGVFLEKTFLALGDSYTIGQSVLPGESFPVQTVAMLRQLGLNFEPPEIIAQTGWTTGNLLSVINNSPPDKPTYDIVTLLIGVNNQYQGRSIDEYRQQFTTLLERSIHYAGNKKNQVFVLSIPDYSVTPFAAGRNRQQIAQQIDSFNSINRSIAQQHQVHYIDITHHSRQAAVYPSLIAGDGLHPSGEQYRIWAAMIVPIIKSLYP